MDLNTKFKRSAICGGVSVVQSARLGSFSNFSSAACTAASIGTLVNSDSTSKDTMILLSRIVSLLTVDTKWAELVTVCSEFPVNRKNNVNTKYSWLFVCIRFPRVTNDCSMIKWPRDQYNDSRLRVVSLIIYFKTPDVTLLVF